MKAPALRASRAAGDEVPVMKADTEIIGHIYDIQGYSVHDGPGIRTTVYTKGCPLRCLWCHSPESQSFSDELSFLPIKCAGAEKCGLCLSACPKQAIRRGTPERSLLNPDETLTKVTVDRSLCDGCMACTKVCPAQALMASGYDISVEDALARVLQDRAFFGSEGGITISGGEPLSQFEFTYALAKASKEAGITVCIDTTGFCDSARIEQMIPVTDLFLYDLKEMDSQKSRALVGVPNELILENARRIAANGGKLQIRVPTIPKLNGDLENIRRTAQFVQTLGSAVTVVQVLPYHRMGIPKYERIGRKYPIVHIDPPSDAYMEERLAIFRELGLPVQLH